jgi:hypothetical protein
LGSVKTSAKFVAKTKNLKIQADDGLDKLGGLIGSKQDAANIY